MATMFVIHGPNAGEWHSLGLRPTTFGRDHNLPAGILDPCVSRRHLEVRYDDVQRSFYAIDLQSRNGVVINGERVRGYRELRDEDSIQLGHTVLVFSTASIEDAEEAHQRIAHYKREHGDFLELLERKAAACRERLLDGTQVFDAIPDAVRERPAA